MKKLFASFLVLSMFVFLLAGCEITDSSDHRDDEKEQIENLMPDGDEENDTALNPEKPKNEANSGEQEKPSGSEEESNTTNPEKPEDEVGSGEQEKPSDSEEGNQPELPEYGTKVGDRFMDVAIDGLNGEKVKTSDYRGKYIIFNVWGTWCGPCKSELPHFSQFASDYADEVVVIAAHTYYYSEYTENYVNQNFADSKIIFAYDSAYGIAFTAAGGTQYYPRTVIIDPNGVIIYGQDGAMTYSDLEAIINQDK